MKKFYCFFCFVSFLIANDEVQNIIKSASEGREVIVENNEVSEVVDNNDKNKMLYKNEVILNWHYAFQKENKRSAEVVGKMSENALIKNVNQIDNVSNGSSGKNNEKTIVVKGFCFIVDEINVGKQPSSLRTECQTNYGSIILFGNLVNVDEKYDELHGGDTLNLVHGLFEEKDALIFENCEAKSATLIGKGGKGVKIEFQDMNNLLIWSAVGNAPFVALEPWTGLASCSDEDGLFEHKRGMTILEKDETVSFKFKITMI